LLFVLRPTYSIVIDILLLREEVVAEEEEKDEDKDTSKGVIKGLHPNQ
jgi:hypothetical protein